jgi:predicted acetyltransferase
LWGFLLSVDLTEAVQYPLAATDEPLLHLVDEPRRLRARVADALWLRIVDLPTALAARRYRTSIDVVLDVTDDLLPDNAGRWRLSGGPEGAVCERTTSPAELRCDIRDLGATYLGNGGLVPLSALGRVHEQRPGAVFATETAFGWHRLPSTIERF